MRPALAALLLALGLALALRPAAGQLVTVGPQFVLADYREVASGLKYRGSGFGGALWARRDRLSAEGAAVRVGFAPAGRRAATPGLHAYPVDGLGADGRAAHASVAVG